MTRFSPEYINYTLSDEASVLQGQWKPNLANWAVMADGSLAFVTGTAKLSGRQYHLFLIDDEGTTYENLAAEVVWLPTLTDLLDMIEEAGYWWSTRLDYDGDDKWYTISAGSIEAGSRIENDHEDRMLAAAKLAVRVLEEGKE